MRFAQKLKGLFDDRKLKMAFAAVKTDMDVLEEKNGALKSSVNEWVIFLDQENRDLKMRVRELEKKLDVIEDSFDEKELTMLRSI
ncbi:hypothetical protein JW898_00450 [Candidatus Woesearchaeota archaeon]|nr:hypothetical protein [Candidatus Woesearchaeota archaeon]